MTHRVAIIALSMLIAGCGAFSFSGHACALTGGPAGTAPVAKPLLEVPVTTEKSTANPGDSITYTAVIKNTGAGAATSLELSDILPKGFSSVTTGNSRYQRSFEDNLDPGRSITADYTVTIGDDVAAGVYTGTVTVTAALTPTASAHTSVTVVVPQVKGAETAEPSLTLAETGVGQLDVFLMLCGASLVGAGMLGLRKTVRA